MLAPVVASSLPNLEAFCRTFETGSFTKAARSMGVTPQATSRSVARLEEALGATLFHRTTRKLSLTEDGSAFLEKAGRIVRDVDEAVAEMAERRGQLAGPMRISAPVTFGRMHLGPALYPFLAEHPAISLTLELDDRRVDASADGFDAVVRHGVIEDSRLVVWPLAASQRVVVASPDYLARQGQPRALEDLAAHRAIYYLNRGIADWRFLDAEENGLIRPKAALRVNNGDVMRDAALAGLGLALLPTFIIWQELRSGALVVVDVGRAVEPESIYVAHPEGRRASVKLRALVESLRTHFGDPPYWDRPA